MSTMIRIVSMMNLFPFSRFCNRLQGRSGVELLQTVVATAVPQCHGGLVSPP
jgi:hypothetical protein